MVVNSRNVDDIFKSISQKFRNASEEQIVANTHKEAECLCEQRFYYVKTSEESRSFEVCPSCNPRLLCEVCHGTGHIEQLNKQTQVMELIPFGCDCVVTEQRVALLNSAGIPEKYMSAEFSFENVQYGYNNISPDMAEKFSHNQMQIMRFCEQAHNLIRKGVEPGTRYFLTLLGPVGTGKTHFAACALKHLIWRFGHSGKFIDFQSLLHQIRDTYTRKLPEDEIMRPLRRVDVLVIDEFGKGRSENEWEIEKLDDIVNSRYNAGKITIITTNYLPPELQALMHKAQRADKNRMPEATQHYLNQDNSENKQQGAQNYWTQSLLDRIGERMYDRILEVSEFVDFIGIPSFRKLLAENFLEKFKKSISKNTNE